MNLTQPITQLISRLWHHIGSRRRGQFWILLVLMTLSSFAEILSIGAVLPFLGALTAPSRIFQHPAAQPFIQALGLTSVEQLLLPLTITFGLAALVASELRVFLLWASIRLSFAVGADLSNGIYRRTLYQPYAVHIARNSSEVINGISTKVGEVIFYILMPTLNLISASVMLVAILLALLSIIPGIALAAFAGFGLIYAFIIRLARNRLKIDSQHIARESTNVIKSLQEGLGGIRDVLIDGSQEIFCTNYRNADQTLRRAQGSNQFISNSPRYGMEALAMLLIATLAYLLAKQPDGLAMAIPMLAAMALGLQRLLPALQQAYGAWSTIHGAQASLQDALELLDQPLPDHAEKSSASPLPFQQQIRLHQISFRYGPQTPWVLKDIDLSLVKGSRVGFIGTTGSGKSTLLDIIMGLLQPTEGTIEIDGAVITVENHRSWQAHIAHVPQAIFLADSNIEENIAFGVPRDQIDHERVRQAARQAQIADIIETWPSQYQTNVGERGVQLSGGQRQRIGIARALYKRADVIIFDESTSALDNETELAVMQAIEALSDDLTVLIIAHRLSTLKNCTQIIEIANGSIQKRKNLTDE
ncbi:ABC transporter ATP-binding protein [Gallionella capsiferriformans]|uniref:ABC transporter related n=1 Tax=Gallionella capsiferriformans (strain ES-2) TaxID=395494 RepID=D9SE13_GALCS|nr:ABC transporter ATP-binding protein [Gallionella capsiferriformans]ADL56835.1 ABC transporter related [Gallionella capsiferriformans ES-2]